MKPSLIEIEKNNHGLHPHNNITLMILDIFTSKNKSWFSFFLTQFSLFTGIYFSIQFFCSSVKAKLVEIETESENTFLKRHLQAIGTPHNCKYIY